MKDKILKKTKNRIDEGIQNLGVAISKTEIRTSIESLIASYSKLDRISLLGKQTYLVDSLANLCDNTGAELIINLLTRGSSKGSIQIIEDISNPDVKLFLKEIIMKYGAQYQWFLEPFQKDWQRYVFSTSYTGSPLLPVVKCKLVLKTGQLIEFESPLPAYGKLVLAQIEHLETINEKMENMGNLNSVNKFVGKENLIKIKEVVDKLLEKKSKPKP